MPEPVVGCTGARKKGDGLCDFSGFTVSSNREVCQDSGCERAIGRVHVSINRTWSNQIDRNFPMAQFTRETTCKTFQSGLGRCIDRNFRERHCQTRIAAGTDNATCCRFHGMRRPRPIDFTISATGEGKLRARYELTG